MFGIRRCLWSLGALPETLVWDRQAGLHAGDGRPTDAFAGFCGALKVGWHFCDARDPQAKGVVERLQDFAERSFEPGRVFANELDYQLQLDAWFDERANPRMHKTLRCRPIDRLVEERAVMAPLPASPPETDRRWVLRVPPDPYLRFDTCDYSLEPRLVGRRVEARVTDREVLAASSSTSRSSMCWAGGSGTASWCCAAGCLMAARERFRGALLTPRGLTAGPSLLPIRRPPNRKPVSARYG